MLESILSRLVVPLRGIASRFDASLTLQPKQFREFLWLSSGQIIALALSLVSIKLMSSIGAQGYGMFVLTTSVAGILASGFYGPVEQGYIRYYFEYAESPSVRKVFLQSLLRLLHRSVYVLVGIAFVAVPVLASFDIVDARFGFSASLLIAVTVLSLPFPGMLNAMRLRKEVALTQVGEKILLVAVLFATSTILGLNETMIVLCAFSATALMMFVRLHLYNREGGFSYGDVFRKNDSLLNERAMYKRVASYSTPFLLWGAVGWLQLNAERWVINGVMTSADVGRYGLAISLIHSSAVIVFNALTQFVTPVIFSKFSSNNSDAIKTGKALIHFYAAVTFLLFFMTAAFLYFFGDQILRFISTSEFVVEGFSLFVLTVGLGIFYVGQAYAQVGLAYQKPRVYLLPKIVVGVLAPIAYYLGCIWNGVLGVAVSLFFIQTIYFFLILAVNRQFLKPNPEHGRSSA